MDCTFKWTGIGGKVCLKEERKVTDFQYRHYCGNPRYYECPFYNNIKGRDIGKAKSVNDFWPIIIYGILGKVNDGKELIDKFNKFRRKVLEKNSDYHFILVYQDRLSVLICNKIGDIVNDSIKDSSALIELNKFVTDIIYKKYMIPIGDAIDKKKNKEVVKLYQEMLEKLLEKLELTKEYKLVEAQYKYPAKYRPNVKRREPIGPKESW